MKALWLRGLAVAASICLAAGMCASCASDKTQSDAPAHYDPAEEVSNLATGTVAENDRFRLDWDGERRMVVLASKEHEGKVWTSVPGDMYVNRPEEVDMAYGVMNSPVILEYLFEGSQDIRISNAADEVYYGGRIGSSAIEGGVSVTYYFDAAFIAVTVDYILDEDGVKMSVDPAKIVEGSSNQAYRISLAPMLAAVPNDTEGGYLVVPSGSGALMYTDVREDGANIRNFSGNIYGRDYAVDMFEQTKTEEAIRMPVFGVKDADSAVCAIVEEGVGGSAIYAVAGDTTWNYSYIYPSFFVRGYNEPNVIKINDPTTYISVEKDIATREKMTVGYYPLFGEEANYAGIADRYAQYLQETCGLPEQAENELLYAKLIGGYQAKDLFLGFPVVDTKTATTYDQAAQIVEELSVLTGGSLVVNMTGFGTTGIAPGKIGGGFNLDKVAGNKKARQAFMEACSKAGVPYFFDFDLVQFGSSGGGFSTLWDAAIGSNKVQARQFVYNWGSKLREEDEYHLILKRSKLDKAMEKLLGYAGKESLTGLGLSSLSSIAYSDYTDSAYPLRYQMAEQVGGLMDQAKKDGRQVLAAAANDYAAAKADVLMDQPTISNRDKAFDADIPLYQMVFKGRVAGAVSSINMTENPEKQFLKAIESGSGLAFTLTGSYDQDMRLSGEAMFYGTLYDDQKGQITDMVERSRTYLQSVAGAHIAAHEILENQVTMTRFDNGVTVYVNFGDADASLTQGTVKAGSFLALDEGGKTIG